MFSFLYELAGPTSTSDITHLLKYYAVIRLPTSRLLSFLLNCKVYPSIQIIWQMQTLPYWHKSIVRHDWLYTRRVEYILAVWSVFMLPYKLNSLSALQFDNIWGLICLIEQELHLPTFVFFQGAHIPQLLIHQIIILYKKWEAFHKTSHLKFPFSLNIIYLHVIKHNFTYNFYCI